LSVYLLTVSISVLALSLSLSLEGCGAVLMVWVPVVWVDLRLERGDGIGCVFAYVRICVG
jgi:hypothetical protein